MKKILFVTSLVFCFILTYSLAMANFYVIATGKKAKRTVLVSPKNTETESGTTLLTALSGITDASATNPYLIIIEPGLYDIGSSSLQMKSYVDIQGSGENVTKITGTLNAEFSGLVRGANNVEIRSLTVENNGTGTYCVGFSNDSSSPTMTHVIVTASGGSMNTYGIRNNNSSSPTMTHVIVTASGGNNNYGVRNESTSSPTMTNVTATGSGGQSSNGVYNNSSSPTMTNVTAIGSGGSSSNKGVYNNLSSPTMTNVTAIGSGGGYTYGVWNKSSSPTMTHVTATASGGSSNNTGVRNDETASPIMTHVTATGSGGNYSMGVSNSSSSLTMTNVTATASGGTTESTGVQNYSSSVVKIDHSTISGETTAVYNQTGSTTYIGNTRLEGGAVDGTCTCAGVYDEDYTFYPSTCP